MDDGHIFRQVRTSPVNGDTLTIEDQGEHHMDAATVVVTLSRPLGQTDTFRSTNGWAAFASNGWVILHDATVIVAIDLDGQRAFHLKPSERFEVFQSVRVEGDTISWHGTPRKSVRIADVETAFAAGLGPVTISGKMPSAYP